MNYKNYYNNYWYYYHYEIVKLVKINAVDILDHNFKIQDQIHDRFKAIKFINDFNLFVDIFMRIKVCLLASE